MGSKMEIKILKHWCRELGEFEIAIINAKEITNIRNIDDPYFWNHHKYSHNDYLSLAQRSTILYDGWKAGKSAEDMLICPFSASIARAYFVWPHIITVDWRPDGLYNFTGDGRHRIRAAQELDLYIPVIVHKR